MHIKSIRLENLFCFKDVSLNFDELDFALFVGRNGAGKSAIFDALCWTLYDQTARKLYTKNKLIRDIPTKQPNALGECIFLDSGKEYIVTRHRGKRNDLEVSENGKAIEIRNSTMMQEKLEKILGMDFKTFLNVAYFSQGDIGKFLVSDSNERINVISSILNLHYFDDARELCKKESDKFSKEIEYDKGVYEQGLSLLNEIDIKAKHSYNKQLKKKIKQTIEKLENISHYLDSILQKKELKEQADKIKTEYDIKKKEIEFSIEHFKKAIDEKNDDIKSKPEFVKKLKEATSQLGDYNVLNESLAKIDEEQKEMIRKKTQWKTRIEALRDKKDENKKVVSLKGQNCPTCHQIVLNEVLNVFYLNIRNCEDEIVKIADKIRLVDNQMDKAGERRKRIDKELELHHDKYAIVEKGRFIIADIERSEKEVAGLVGEMDKIKADGKRELGVIKTRYEEKKVEYNKFSPIDISDYEERSAEFDKLDGERNEFESELKLVKFQIDEYYRKLRITEAAKERMEAKKKNVEKAEYWKAAFPKIKLKMIGDVIPIIEHETNKYLDDVLPGKKITFLVDPDKKQNKLDMMIKDVEFGIERILEGWSGGEKDRMTMAVFLALNKIASMRSGKAVDFIIMDEKFAKIDDEGRHLILELLKKEYGNRKVWAVSHVDVTNEFKNVIKFSKVNGVSSVDVEENLGYTDGKF